MQNETLPVVGVDLGGTSLRAAVVRDGEVLAARDSKTRADRGVDAVIDRLERAIREALEKAGLTGGEYAAIGVGAPGAVDASAGIVRRAPNLDWDDVPLGKILAKRMGVPVLLGNDVEFGLIGEHVYGAGRGHLHLAAIFVGTGIGGGLIVNGAPHGGARGAAGEIGHMVVVPGGRRCGCGRKGCVEAYGSKTAMEAMLREQADDGRSSLALQLMEERGRRVLSSSVIKAALDEGDAPMKEAVKTAQYYLGLLTANLVNTIDPEAIVFGGGVVDRLGEKFLKPIATKARKHFLRPDDEHRIRIVPALLGDDAATIGAAVAVERRWQSL